MREGRIRPSLYLAIFVSFYGFFAAMREGRIRPSLSFG